MRWLVTLVAVLPVLAMAYMALAPSNKGERTGAQWLLALVCASAGSLLLAGNAPSLLGLMPCAWQSFAPPCQNMQTLAAPGTYAAGLGFLLWALAALSLRAPGRSPFSRSERLS